MEAKTKSDSILTESCGPLPPPSKIIIFLRRPLPVMHILNFTFEMLDNMYDCIYQVVLILALAWKLHLLL